MRLAGTLLGAVIGSGALLTAQGHRAPAIVHIGAGHPYSLVEGMNDRRQIVGVMNFPGDEGRFHAYVWQDGVLRDLNVTGGSHAYDINDRGEIVGVADLGNGLGDPVMWVDGRVIRLPMPDGELCAADGINNHGLIVGSCFGLVDSGGVLWRDGVFERIAVPAGVRVVPTDVNDRGVVIGLAFREDSTSFPFIWQDGQLTDLNAMSDRPFERVSAINRRGQIVGEGPGAGGRGQGLLFEAGRTIVIAPLPGESTAIPYAINDRGQVTGHSGSCGFVWTDGVSRPLGCLPGGDIAYGTAINMRGDVAGHGVAPPDNVLPNAVLWPGAAKPPFARVAR